MGRGPRPFRVEAGRFLLDRRAGKPVRDTLAEEPATVILRSRRDSAKRIAEHGERPNRRADEPAPAITGEAWRWEWDTEADTLG